MRGPEGDDGRSQGAGKARQGQTNPTQLGRTGRPGDPRLRGSRLAPHTGQVAPPARKRPPISHREGSRPPRAPTARPTQPVPASSSSGVPTSPCSPRLSTAHSQHVASSRTSWPATPPRPAPARPIQAASTWPSPAARCRSHPPRACTAARLLCRALFPDIYLAGPLAEARSLLKRHLPAASLCLPTCKRSMASTPGS